MNKLFINNYLLLLIRIFLAFIFIYAGIEKISNPSAFSDAVNNYKLLPLHFVNIFAIILPWTELVAGILLLFGILVKENSFIISSLIIIFMIAIGISLIRGLNIDCGCFGTSAGSKIGLLKLGENLFLVVLGFILMKYDSLFLSFSSS